MNKRLLVLLLALCLGATNLTGCTSGGTQDDSEVAESNDEQFAEEGEGDFADGDSDEDTGDSAGDTAATEEGGEPAADGAGDLAAGDTPVEDGGDDLAIGEEEPPVDGLAATDEAAPPAGDELSLDEPAADDGTGDVAATTEDAPPPMDEPSAEIANNEPPPPTDEPVFDEPATDQPSTEVADTEPPAASTESAEPAPVDTYTPPKAAASFSPLLKIKDAAFTAADGTTLNRVYVARPKDNWKSVSNKLYGTDRVADLKKWNPYVRANGVNAGKKIYYSSPSNPSDGRMLTYYEEQNIPPQMYTSQPGDNLRTVSKNLLGFSNAWMEVWSTNMNVESKGSLPAGTELRYWPESAAPTQTLAQNTPQLPPPTEPALPETAPQPPTDAMMPPPVDPTTQAGMEPPPVPPTDAGVDPLAPPPPIDDPTATGSLDNPAVPPPETVPPPPPPVEPKPVKKAPPVADASMDGGMDADTTMIIGLGGILLIAAAILFVVIRKNRAKRMDLGQTQV